MFISAFSFQNVHGMTFNMRTMFAMEVKSVHVTPKWLGHLADYIIVIIFIIRTQWRVVIGPYNISDHNSNWLHRGAYCICSCWPMAICCASFVWCYVTKHGTHNKYSVWCLCVRRIDQRLPCVPHECSTRIINAWLCTHIRSHTHKHTWWYLYYIDCWCSTPTTSTCAFSVDSFVCINI